MIALGSASVPDVKISSDTSEAARGTPVAASGNSASKPANAPASSAGAGDGDVVLERGDLLAQSGPELAVVEAAVGRRREQHADVADAQDVAQLLGPVVRQQRVEDGARLHDTHVDDDGLVPVGQLDRDDVAGLHAHGDQVVGQAVAVAVELPVGHLPRLRLVDDRQRVRRPARMRADQLAQPGGVPQAGRLVGGAALGQRDGVHGPLPRWRCRHELSERSGARPRRRPSRRSPIGTAATGRPAPGARRTATRSRTGT